MSNEKGSEGKFGEKNRVGSMTDRSWELDPGIGILVIERTSTSGFCAEGCYSEHSNACRRAELTRRGVKVKKVRKISRSLIKDDFKAHKREFVLDSLLNRDAVKRVNQRSDVSRSGASENKSSSIVLDLLKF